ncbi:hypothetical protein Gogos_003188 [Gossypium gossypioides]|uniref:Leucine-rich repeat-containing N-terminal plant-type domain-containing protein n=1 Tax=Gossypium gossypioides TaxID=34282 RepID=A0A7J9CL79_GOSGO|nr:hypothetical protein [Gossypium gossypioides]
MAFSRFYYPDEPHVYCPGGLHFTILAFVFTIPVDVIKAPSRGPDEFGGRGKNVIIDQSLVFENLRLRNTYITLQDCKKAILLDLFNLTVDWVRPDVCDYTSVYCTPTLDNKRNKIVTSIDLNHEDITGHLPEELGLLTGFVKLMLELDLSNNWLASKFPEVSVMLHLLKFLDLRFNEFEGTVPKELFDKDLDAIFINHN